MWNDVISHLRVLFTSIVSREDGQTLVEYALIIALVSVALVGALTALTGNITGVFTFIGQQLNGV